MGVFERNSHGNTMCLKWLFFIYDRKAERFILTSLSHKKSAGCKRSGGHLLCADWSGTGIALRRRILCRRGVCLRDTAAGCAGIGVSTNKVGQYEKNSKFVNGGYGGSAAYHFAALGGVCLGSGAD